MSNDDIVVCEPCKRGDHDNCDIQNADGEFCECPYCDQLVEI